MVVRLVDDKSMKADWTTADVDAAAALLLLKETLQPGGNGSWAALAGGKASLSAMVTIQFRENDYMYASRQSK